MSIFNALTIAGSDSGGGAGIQADLKTFSALGVYGASAITALTAQNTRGVQGVFPVPATFVAAQCDAVFSDLRIDSVKCGMLADAEIIEAVAAALQRYRPPVFVLDTVMVAKSGDALLAPQAVRVLRESLLPLADIVTPNLPEAAALLETEPAGDETAMRAQGRALLALGARAVLMKGGHLPADRPAMERRAGNDTQESPDWLITADRELRLTAPRVATRHTHGTGCTLSAALAALRPQRPDWATAVRDAKTWLTEALRQADRLTVGQENGRKDRQGIGPPHHFHRWW